MKVAAAQPSCWNFNNRWLKLQKKSVALAWQTLCYQQDMLLCLNIAKLRFSFACPC